MQTMYDRLGDLLNEVLKNGKLPQSDSDSSKVSFFYVPKDEHSEQTTQKKDFSEKSSKNSSATDEIDKKNPDGGKKNENSSYFFSSPEKATGIRIPREKIIPSEVKTAIAFIGIGENASFDEAKKAYREKLMYYHPDRRNDNPVLQKIAKEKTARLLKEWEIIEKWYGEK